MAHHAARDAAVGEVILVTGATDGLGKALAAPIPRQQRSCHHTMVGTNPADPSTGQHPARHQSRMARRVLLDLSPAHGPRSHRSR